MEKDSRPIPQISYSRFARFRAQVPVFSIRVPAQDSEGADNWKATPVSPKESQVGQPPIMPTLFESRKPKACGVEKQQHNNPDRIHRPQPVPIVNRKKLARASHRGRRNQQE